MIDGVWNVRPWYAVVVESGRRARRRVDTGAASWPGVLALPLIAKDTIKELPSCRSSVAPDVGASGTSGRAAVTSDDGRGRCLPIGAVLESSFHRSVAASELHALPGEVLEVFCRCDLEVAASRYRARACTRHAGHFDQIRTPEELWNVENTGCPEPATGNSTRPSTTPWHQPKTHWHPPPKR